MANAVKFYIAKEELNDERQYVVYRPQCKEALILKKPNKVGTWTLVAFDGATTEDLVRVGADLFFWEFIRQRAYDNLKCDNSIFYTVFGFRPEDIMTSSKGIEWSSGGDSFIIQSQGKVHGIGNHEAVALFPLEGTMRAGTVMVDIQPGDDSYLIHSSMGDVEFQTKGLEDPTLVDDLLAEFRYYLCVNEFYSIANNKAGPRGIPWVYLKRQGPRKYLPGLTRPLPWTTEAERPERITIYDLSIDEFYKLRLNYDIHDGTKKPFHHPGHYIEYDPRTHSKVTIPILRGVMSLITFPELDDDTSVDDDGVKKRWAKWCKLYEKHRYLPEPHPYRGAVTIQGQVDINKFDSMVQLPKHPGIFVDEAGRVYDRRTRRELETNLDNDLPSVMVENHLGVEGNSYKIPYRAIMAELVNLQKGNNNEDQSNQEV